MGTSNSQHNMSSAEDGDSSSSNNRSRQDATQANESLRMLRRLAAGYNMHGNSNSGPARGVTSARRVRLSYNPGDYSDSDDDDEEEEGSSTCQHDVSNPPDTRTLEQSEFYLMTKMACGLKADSKSQFEQPPPVVKMISQREMGMRRGGDGFSSRDISTAMSHFLPNDMTIEDRYCYKAFCGTYSQDGDIFLSACQDRKLRLYRTTGKRFTLLRKIAARDVGWSILDTAFSPDGSCCVYSSWSDSIYLVHLFGDSESQDALMLNPSQSRFCIFSLVFSQDGQEIMCGANDGFLYVYNRFSNKRTLQINGHCADVNTVAYADNTSHILYSGSDDGLCKVWDRRTLSESYPKPVGVLAGHKDGITFIEPRGDGRHFLSNSKDQTIKLWDVRKFSNENDLEETRKLMNQHWDYRWQKVPVEFKNVPMRVGGDTSVMTYRGHAVLQTLIRCHFSPRASTGQRYIYTGCAHGKIYIYDALTGRPVKVLLGHRACVRDVSWHPYKPEIASTSWDTIVARWQYKGEDDSTDEDEEEEEEEEDDKDEMEELDSTRRSSRWPRRSARINPMAQQSNAVRPRR